MTPAFVTSTGTGKGRCGLAAGQNPGERERRRWAVRQLDGKRYSYGTPPAEVHLDMRAAPKLTLRNLTRSAPAVWAEHAACVECADILAADGRGEWLLDDEQWHAFRDHRRHT